LASGGVLATRWIGARDRLLRVGTAGQAGFSVFSGSWPPFLRAGAIRPGPTFRFRAAKVRNPPSLTIVLSGMFLLIEEMLTDR